MLYYDECVLSILLIVYNITAFKLPFLSIPIDKTFNLSNNITRCAIKKIKTIQQNCAILLVEGKIIERRHNYVELSR